MLETYLRKSKSCKCSYSKYNPKTESFGVVPIKHSAIPLPIPEYKLSEISVLTACNGNSYSH